MGDRRPPDGSDRHHLTPKRFDIVLHEIAWSPTSDRLAFTPDFCALALALRGERLESYVGSPEHLHDVDQLLVLAPDPIRGAGLL